MELIQDFTQEITVGAIIIAIAVTIIKSFFSNLAKSLWEYLKKHLKKTQKLYYGAIGSFITLFVGYSIFTVKNQINFIQSKLDKFENLTNTVSKGKIIYDYESFINLVETQAINNFSALRKSNTEINFPNKDKWKNDTHLTNVFGIIFVDRGKKRVFFQYKSIVGKNKMSDKTFYTTDYLEDNPKLFANLLILQGNDKKAFLNNSVKNCLNKPLKKDLIKMEEDFKKGIYEYYPCDFRQSFFYVTGRILGHEQKTFNEINHIYYIIIPFKEKGESYLYFYYSFNSNDSYFLTTQVYAMLETFKKNVIEYKNKIKNYQNNEKAD